MFKFIQKILIKKKQKTLEELIVTELPRRVAEALANR